MIGMTRIDRWNSWGRAREAAVAVADSPVLGRRLARDLRRYRLKAARTITEVADQLECSPAKVSRIETGAVRVRVQDLRALVEIYEIEGEERAELYALVRQARARGWWYEFADVLPPDYATLYGLENAAASVHQHRPSLIGSANAPEAVTERRIEPDVLAEQLERLLDVGERSNFDIQVLEFEAGVHPAVGVAFTVFDFAIPNVPPVVYTEHLSRNTYLDEPEEVEIFTGAWAGGRAGKRDVDACLVGSLAVVATAPAGLGDLDLLRVTRLGRGHAPAFPLAGCRS
jgi:transcriptional regulator with XRE-family HTH domain